MLTLLLVILLVAALFGALGGVVDAIFSWPVVVILGIILLVHLLN